MYPQPLHNIADYQAWRIATLGAESSQPSPNRKEETPPNSSPADSHPPSHATISEDNSPAAGWERNQRSGSPMEKKLRETSSNSGLKPKSRGKEASTSHHPNGTKADHSPNSRFTARESSSSLSTRPSHSVARANSPDIVFVGAGPVGLWAAIQLKLRKPELTIRILEKRETYTRDNSVKLKADRFAGCAQDEWGIVANLKSKLKESPLIPIQTLENTLKDLATKLNINIKIVPGGVSDVETQVVDAYPSATLIIGSDGAHSRFRTQMFPEENYQKQQLGFSAHIKYNIDGAAQKIEKKELYRLLTKTHTHLVHEHVGKCTEGKVPVTLEISIDKKTYDSLKDVATAKNPVRIFSHEPHATVPPNFLDDVKSLLGLRIVNHNTKIDPSTIRLSVTKIPQHYCKSVLEPHKGSGHYKALLGDAAMGLSFFKGLNAGIKSANKFAVVVTSNWDIPSSTYENPSYHKFFKYQAWFEEYAQKKIASGNRKNLQLSGINKFISVSSKVPFQPLKYSNKEVNTFKKAIDDLIGKYNVSLHQERFAEISDRSQSPDASSYFRLDSQMRGAPASGHDLQWALSNIELNSFRTAIHSLTFTRFITDVKGAASHADIPMQSLKHLLQSEMRSNGTSQFQLTTLGEEYVEQQFNSRERENLITIIASR